jgi:hypothetical protein
MNEDERHLYDIPVTWQLAAVIFALVFVPLALVPVPYLLAHLERRNYGTIAAVCGSIAGVLLLLAVLGVRSRLRSLVDAERRAASVRGLWGGIGFFIMASAWAYVSYRNAVEHDLSHYWVPTGLYTFGLFLIGQAMTAGGNKRPSPPERHAIDRPGRPMF